MSEGASDGELVRLIAQGGPGARAAEEALFLRFAPRVRLYGLRHLRDEDRARELVQTALLGVIEAARAGRVAELDKVDRFVLGAARNAALKMRAVDARARLTPDDELASIGFDPPEPIDRAALARCFDALEPRSKQVVYLTFTEDRSADEIAAALDLTAGNVRVLRHRAIASIRACLEGGGLSA